MNLAVLLTDVLIDMPLGLVLSQSLKSEHDYNKNQKSAFYIPAPRRCVCIELLITATGQFAVGCASLFRWPSICCRAYLARANCGMPIYV